jgi:hypothetical protein
VDYDADAVRALLSGILTSPISRELSYRLEQALEVTDALWDLVPIVVAAGEAHDRQSPAETADQSPAAQRLTGDRRSHVRAVADGILEMQDAALSGQAFDESKVSGVTIREAVSDPFGIVARFMDVPGQTELAVSLVERAASLSSDELFYLRAYTQAKLKSERTPMLLRALFITAIGTVEPLVARMVLLLLYYANPGQYGSLSAVELDDDARSLCYGPPEKWCKSLVTKLGVTTLAEAIDWGQLTRLWEDRNVIAHRGSITDSRHSANIGTEAGSVINVDAATVRSAIDVIGATRFALVACTWEHLVPGSGNDAAEMSGPPLWESLRAGRWEQAELLGKLQEQLIADPEDRATARVNRWLAIDMGRGPEAIRVEVKAWKVTGLPRVYTLARLVLLREDEQALALLRELRGTGDVTQMAIDTWPLFDRLRGTGSLSSS